MKKELTTEEAILLISKGTKSLGWVISILGEADDNAPLTYMIIGESETVSYITEKLEE